MKRFIKQILPKSVLRIALRARASMFPDESNQLPVLGPDASPKLRALREAWKLGQVAEASAPGSVLAYYSVVEDGVRFPGEREWQPRWDVFRKLVEYKGRRILELGCNMGLLSCHLMKEADAAAVLGVDYDAQVLKAAKKVAEAYGVNVTFVQNNFDTTSDWESELLSFEPDIVFALNVLNWLHDKQRMLIFLSNFDEIIFEGHESLEVESRRFKDLGFTKIRPITKTERNRDVIHCVR